LSFSEYFFWENDLFKGRFFLYTLYPSRKEAIMARSRCGSSRSTSSRSRSGSGRSSRSYRSSRKGSYVKSHDNSTRQTCAQRYSPTKTRSGTWYDAEGNQVRDSKSYFGTIDANGKFWKKC
jgi:hypothetical protein